jgi:hypothetical protein
MNQSDSNVSKLLKMLAADPMLFPFDWDRKAQKVEFVGIREEEYTKASFLDERILGSKPTRGVVPYGLLRNFNCATAKPCHFIFHVSHCGSTLLSRLLGVHPGCFSLREPKVLKGFDSQEASEIQWLFMLLSRTFRSDQNALIKATSFCSAFASQWLSNLRDSKAVLLTIPLRSFLASILDGSVVDIESQKVSRWLRLQKMQVNIEQPLETLSVGQIAAMSWLCEMLTLRTLAEEFETRCQTVRFDAILESPDEILNSILKFLELASPFPRWSELSMWQEYAKRPGLFYNREMRSMLLEQAERTYEVEIAEGISWIESIRDPRVSQLPLE